MSTTSETLISPPHIQNILASVFKHILHRLNSDILCGTLRFAVDKRIEERNQSKVQEKVIENVFLTDRYTSIKSLGAFIYNVIKDFNFK